MIQFLKKRLVWLVLAAAATIGRRLLRSWWRRRRAQEDEPALPPEPDSVHEGGAGETPAPTAGQSG